ncbi:antitoxin PrlF [Bathymodiolus platifrons methanotrophic gill symbiont]|uniref:AbrB/MazE/SpoVT family DNA-binding domain-containing protein n=1 Tax=Bathymodiolus platifrons methanotrophic gill symbiont TaxID=113268 RepID=UPI000B412E1B|nr:AbrB/MazE/SpoVT family DNA-binding domain-containing protein [Bathymodiolus platifrons methanotrophic gill symbiont]GAW86897.1 antitoxin PrlF [Bathymodiolus platifrons methanotrophic gill symbiont]GFO76873.1 antitoxin PrlF [Bathymodiolus platifrons methanotrophic gill symbiont]
MQLAKLSSKGQMTIPIEIRENLHLKTGDTLAWDAKPDGSVSVRKVTPLDLDYISAVSGTLSEWNSAADEEAYRDL